MTMRIILWTAAFLIPSLMFGVPVPHTPYVLIPALAAVDGLADRFAFRRVLLWLVLVFLYEITYSLPTGVLTVPVLTMALVHVGASRMIRMESLSDALVGQAVRIKPLALMRSIGIALVWMGGLIILSAVWGSAVASGALFSWQAVFAVWWFQGAFSAALGALATVLILLYADRIRGTAVMFSDHAIVQTKNLSD